MSYSLLLSSSVEEKKVPIALSRRQAISNPPAYAQHFPGRLGVREFDLSSDSILTSTRRFSHCRSKRFLSLRRHSLAAWL